MQAYRYYRPRMEAYAASERYRAWYTANRDLAEYVLQRIEQEGALSSAQFEAPEDFKGGGWWHRKPAKTALENLFSAGRLMIRARSHFARVYDLAERVLPAEIVTTPASAEESALYAVESALRANGIITAEECGWQIADQALARQALLTLVEAGKAVPLNVAELEGTFYSTPRALAHQDQLPLSALHLLSPFDNLVISRPRLERLFGFDYHLECYLPVHKRREGYYCLPVLWGDRFMARLDPKADRKTATLIVHHIQVEDVADAGALAEPLAAKLVSLARFNGCERVLVERSNQPQLAEQVNQLLSRLQQ
ncbi:MAG: winged helix-turn-helix domain-containing protein [Anaerolineae bacterium]